MGRREKGFSLAPPIRLNEAQQQLAAGCYHLALKLAGEFARRHDLDYDECLSTATARLVHAAARFNPGLGFRPSTFFHKCIRSALMRLLEQRTQRSRLRFVGFFDRI
jgi:DNA-directed RNA polymerase specialized sigma subunit